MIVLTDAVGHTATHTNPFRFDRDLLDHDRDLLDGFGVEFSESLLRAGPNIDFAELAEQSLARLARPAFGVDLVIVAYGLPDLNSTRAVAAHLNKLLGGSATAFALSEQGLHAPFTALRIIEAFAARGRCRSACLFVLEQSTRPHWDSLVHGSGIRDTAALLVFGSGSGSGCGTGSGTGLRPGRVGYADGGAAGLRAEVLARVGDAADETMVVAGPWVAGGVLDGLSHVHRVPGGSYATSVWRALAEHHVPWTRRFRRIVLCDHDPRHGRGSVAELIASGEVLS